MDRFAPRMVTPRHWPPETVSGRSVQSTNTDPASLLPRRVAPKNDVRRTSQPTNAADSSSHALKRQPSKVQDSNVTPRAVASVRSTSRKVQST